MKRVYEVFQNRNSKQWMIGELAEQGYTKMEVFHALLPLVQSQTPPMVFTYNPGGGLSRRPKSMDDQVQELKNEIGRVFVKMDRAVGNKFDSPELEIDENRMEDRPNPVRPIRNSPDENQDEAEMEEETPKAEEQNQVRPVAGGKKNVRDEIKYFVKRVREIRRYLDRQKELTDAAIDTLGMRPVEAAGKLIPAGIPADALLHAMTISWPKDARDSAGVQDFNLLPLSAELASGRGITIGKDRDAKGNPFHPLFGYILTLIENRQPVFLCGPMGTGKSHVARQVADYLFSHLETPYAEVSLSGATRGDLLGRPTMDPNRAFVISYFTKIYESGGVFNFEEMDSAVPEVLNVLNNAIASSEFHNSMDGEIYLKSPDFVAVATGNTWGTGPNRLHVARDKQDAAALDRFRMGRVFLPLDENVEDFLASRHL